MRFLNFRDSTIKILLRATTYVLLVCSLPVFSSSASESTVTGEPETYGLDLRECVRRALGYNESLQIRRLEWEISQSRAKSEYGIFEPELVGTVNRQNNERPNTAEQQANLFFTTLLTQRDKAYNTRVEWLVPTGARLQAGYSLSDLSNNLNSFSNEFVSTLSFNVIQPLLKNAGVSTTLAGIRVAEASAEVAFQEYRRQRMVVASRTESAYWDLYLTQEQERLTRESVKMTEIIVHDVRTSFEVGKASKLELLEAEAGLALRKARQSDAYQKLVEASNNLSILISASMSERGLLYRATDEPKVDLTPTQFLDGWLTALELNPDYLRQEKQITIETIRKAFAANQRLPQLDLTATYGLNGLGDTFEESWEDVNNQDFPFWSVGVEVRIPLGGGIRDRYSLQSASLRKEQAELSLNEIKTQIDNSLESATGRVRYTRDNVENYQKVTDFNLQVLETELARLSAGKTSIRAVLEAEEKVFEARLSVMDSLTQHQKALLEWELIRGTILKSKGLENTSDEVMAKFSKALNSKSQQKLRYRSSPTLVK